METSVREKYCNNCERLLSINKELTARAEKAEAALEIARPKAMLIQIERLTAANKVLELAWTDGGVNSADCLTACMAEGEGSDEKVYMSMAKQVLTKMREAIARAASIKGGGE
jgi:hypothetical protein